MFRPVILSLFACVFGIASCFAEEAKPKAQILILGDSISMGYMPHFQYMLKEQADVIHPKENCLGTKNGVAKVDDWLKLGTGKWNVIHFNFGLHDLKHETAKGEASANKEDPRQSEPEAYEKNLRAIVAKLKASGTRLVYATTTPVPPGATKPLRAPEDAVAYNDIAVRIMKENDIPVDDLFSYAQARLENIQRPANVHFTSSGSKVLATEVSRHIRLVLATPGKSAAAKPKENAAAKTNAGPKWARAYPDFPNDLRLETGLVCATYGERKVLMDLYAPKTPGPHPAILFIHGGGWARGEIEQDKPLAERLARKGFVCALVDYRLSGEAPYPAQIHDCKAAVRFLRANASQYGINPDKIGSIGGSAGGQLSGLLGATNGDEKFEGNGGNADRSSAIQACIVMASTMDMKAAYGDKPNDSVTQYLGGTGKEKPDLYAEISPVNHVAKNNPPTIFIEGEKDNVKLGRPEMMEKLKGFGIETAVHTLKDGPHPFWMSQPWLDQTAEIALEFFTRNLK